MDEMTTTSRRAAARAAASACPDDDAMPVVRLTWDAADDEIVQAAQMIAFYATYPSAEGDPSELDDFRL